MMHWGNHMGPGDWIFSILGILIILGLIVALIVWAVSPRGDRGGSAITTAESPREILDRRLASGQLTADRYEQLRETLGDPTPSTSDPRPRTPAGAPG